MKTICLLFVSLLPFLSYSQDGETQSKKVLFLGPTVGYPIFSGDNFLNHSYHHQPSIAFELGFNIYRDFGLSAYARYHRGRIKTTEYIGNSTRGDILDRGLSAFYLIPINEKWLFVPKAGFAAFHLTNQLENNYGDDYHYTSEGEIYFVRPEMNYFLNQRISLFYVLEYGYVDLSRIRVNSTLRHLYRESHQFHSSIGLRLWVLRR